MTTTANSFAVARFPAQVSFGSGSIASLTGVTAALGVRVFVCVDPFIATTAAFSDAHARLLDAGLVVELFTEIVPELPIDGVERAAEVARSFAPDVLIGFGGGSALDLAKVVALLLAHPGAIANYYGENQVPGPVLPLIAVPTTAGTGSEVTPVAVVSDPARALKVGISSPHLIPRFAIVDPRLTLGAPAAVTAHSGIDAFVHAVESFTAARRTPDWGTLLPVSVGRNMFSSLLALEAIEVIARNLPTAVAQPHDLAAREAMAWGSLLAGAAFGTGGTHLSHALQYPLGARTKTPHGLGTGLLLPYVMQACLPATRDELAEIAAALGVGGKSKDEDARSAIAAVRSLVAEIGIPSNLAELGVTEDDLPDMAALALTMGRLANNSMIEATQETLELILGAALHGDRSRLPQ